MGSVDVKGAFQTWGGPGHVSYLQYSKLACSSFIDAERRNEILSIRQGALLTPIRQAS